MGTYYYYYVGPYVRVPKTTTNTTKKISSCTNTECSQHKKEIHTNYCSQCGSKVGNVEIPVTKKVSLYDLGDELSENLANPRHHVDYDNNSESMFLTSNHDIKLGRGTNYEASCDMCKLEVTPDLISKEIEIFKQYHSKDIDELKKIFGEGSLHFSWGVLGYYN